MLKKEFNTVYDGFLCWIFQRNTSHIIARMFGIKKLNPLESQKILLLVELLDFIKSANKNRTAEMPIIIPKGICSDDFYRTIANIKNNTV